MARRRTSPAAVQRQPNTRGARGCGMRPVRAVPNLAAPRSVQGQRRTAWPATMHRRTWPAGHCSRTRAAGAGPGRARGAEPGGPYAAAANHPGEGRDPQHPTGNAGRDPAQPDSGAWARGGTRGAPSDRGPGPGGLATPKPDGYNRSAPPMPRAGHGGKPPYRRTLPSTPSWRPDHVCGEWASDGPVTDRHASSRSHVRQNAPM
jgi:hypothetical protein